MRLAIKSVLFNIVAIILFSVIYFLFKIEFENFSNKNKITYLDLLLLSTTIQAGVGISTINPITSTTKILTIIQQILMISTHVFTLYLFTT